MINWKLRLQNKATLIALLGLEIPKNIQDGVNTFVYILVLIGVVNDPTTAGISDSNRALDYHEPSED